MQTKSGLEEISFGPVENWDDAYANSAHIPGGDAYFGIWGQKAAAFRETAGGALDAAYGEEPRERLDLFMPAGATKGLLVFVHGGYWMQSAKEDWSHLAKGATEFGWAVGTPSYPLCPQASLRDIARACARAIAQAAARVAGPIVLCGHSAGGQLAARLVCAPTPLATEVRRRVVRVAPISGLFDLRPLMHTAMNATLGIDDEQALRESPAHLMPPADVNLLAIVGGAERPEFLRQSRLGAALWSARGAPASLITLPQRHHFDVIEFLEDREHPLLARLLR